MKNKLSIGFSTCPNDTFIFDALVNGKINTGGLEFEVHLADVEELNRMALKGMLDVTKLSYHAYGHFLENYILLNSGSALGSNCGPLLIGEAPIKFSSITNETIAIPGKMTTANFLLGLFLPGAKNKKEMLFSKIEDAVLNGSVDLGLIIHENRFTYEHKGLVKIADMGELWETETKLPIPLGGIVIKRDLPLHTQTKTDALIRQSIEYAFNNREDVMPFVSRHAQEMDEAVMLKHIELYVNQYSVALGETGRKAIEVLFQKAWNLNIIPKFEGSLILKEDV